MIDSLYDDLDLVVTRTGHSRFRELCNPVHPDYNPGYIPIVRAEAARIRGEPDPPLPSLASQALSAAGAVARVATAAVTGQPILVPDEVYKARLSICRGVPIEGIVRCDHYRTSDDRCGMADGCGCYISLKAGTATESCPVGKWDSYRT
jgi:hypothetical protein